MGLYKEKQRESAAGCLPLLVAAPDSDSTCSRVLMDLNLTGYSFLGIHLDKSCTGALGSALGITDPEVGAHGHCETPSEPIPREGLSQVGLYLGNVLLMAFIGYITWFQQAAHGCIESADGVHELVHAALSGGSSV
ncbi:hypothetical protein [Aminiphilus circumscriptus]|uniref:hypothetical protein n=1 Tax=Aminiphilus circumscriptus TaxID=290732 RepID=UPI0004B06C1E|nr:hypothetical protein [Aminiphilus circumscriptus]